MNYTDKPVGWIMLHHRCTREEAEAMLPYSNDPMRLVLPPVIDRHEVNGYEWSAIASKVESLRRSDRDEKVLQERLRRKRQKQGYADEPSIPFCMAWPDTNNQGTIETSQLDIIGRGVTEPADVDDITTQPVSYDIERSVIGGNFDTEYTDEQRKVLIQKTLNTPNFDKLSEASFRLELAKHELRRKVNSANPPTQD